MKIRYLFSFAALAFIMAACSSDENTNETSGTNGQMMPFTATISLDQTTTRGLTDDGSNITTSWKENEQVALIHNGQIDKMSVTAVNNETKVATITGSISNATNGETVKVIYPASAVDEKAMVVKDDLLKTQDGLLTTIEEKLDYRTAETTLAVSSGGATFGAAVTLVLQHAIWKLSLTDGTNAISASQLVVKDGDNKELTTVKLSPAASSLYIAMAPANSVDMNFEATVGDDTYTYSKKGISLKAGKYYVSTMAMKAPEPGKMTVEAAGYKNIYDTKPHGITVTVKDPNPATGATIMYGETEGSYNKSQSPTYTDVGKHTVYYQVTMDKYETVTGSADVEITQADATIGFANASVTITYGDAVPTNTLTNTGDGEVKYSTTATNVTVDESTGAVTVKGAGEATIKATVTDGTNYKYKDKEASYTLTVKAKTVAVTGVSLNKTSLDMKVGDSETLTATVAPSNATNQEVTWSSNKTSVATVDANGKVTAAGVGEATITVTTKDGSKTDACKVTVKAKGSVEDYNKNDSNNW